MLISQNQQWLDLVVFCSHIFVLFHCSINCVFHRLPQILISTHCEAHFVKRTVTEAAHPHSEALDLVVIRQVQVRDRSAT